MIDFKAGICSKYVSEIQEKSIKSINVVVDFLKMQTYKGIDLINNSILFKKGKVIKIINILRTFCLLKLIVFDTTLIS